MDRSLAPIRTGDRTAAVAPAFEECSLGFLVVGPHDLVVFGVGRSRGTGSDNENESARPAEAPARRARSRRLGRGRRARRLARRVAGRGGFRARARVRPAGPDRSGCLPPSRDHLGGGGAARGGQPPSAGRGAAGERPPRRRGRRAALPAASRRRRRLRGARGSAPARRAQSRSRARRHRDRRSVPLGYAPRAARRRARRCHPRGLRLAQRHDRRGRRARPGRAARAPAGRDRPGGSHPAGGRAGGARRGRARGRRRRERAVQPSAACAEAARGDDLPAAGTARRPVPRAHPVRRLPRAARARDRAVPPHPLSDDADVRGAVAGDGRLDVHRGSPQRAARLREELAGVPRPARDGCATSWSASASASCGRGASRRRPRPSVLRRRPHARRGPLGATADRSGLPLAPARQRRAAVDARGARRPRRQRGAAREAERSRRRGTRRCPAAPVLLPLGELGAAGLCGPEERRRRAGPLARRAGGRAPLAARARARRRAPPGPARRSGTGSSGFRTRAPRRRRSRCGSSPARPVHATSSRRRPEPRAAAARGGGRRRVRRELAPAAPALLLLVDEDVAPERPLVADVLGAAAEAGVAVLWLGRERRDLPGECAGIVELDRGDAPAHVHRRARGRTWEDVTADGLGPELARELALGLAPVRDTSAVRGGGIPDRVALLELLGLAGRRRARRSTRAGPRSADAPDGRDRRGRSRSRSASTCAATARTRSSPARPAPARASCCRRFIAALAARAPARAALVPARRLQGRRGVQGLRRPAAHGRASSPTSTATSPSARSSR